MCGSGSRQWDAQHQWKAPHGAAAPSGVTIRLGCAHDGFVFLGGGRVVVGAATATMDVRTRGDLSGRRPTATGGFAHHAAQQPLLGFELARRRARCECSSAGATIRVGNRADLALRAACPWLCPGDVARDRSSRGAGNQAEVPRSRIGLRRSPTNRRSRACEAVASRSLQPRPGHRLRSRSKARRDEPKPG